MNGWLAIGLQVAWCVAESLAVRRFRNAPGGSVGKLPRIIAGLAFSFAAVTTVFAFSTPMAGATAIGPIVLIGSGVALRVLAIRELGPLFRDSIDLVSNHEHIQSGPYRFLKHPAEVGFLMAMSGLCLLGPHWISIALLTILFLLCFYRMRLENRLIAGAFPACASAEQNESRPLV